MYLKSINKVIGYKDLPDGFSCDFNDITYIVGDNFQKKTTVGSLFYWCLTGCSLYGNDKEQVQNDKNYYKNVIVDITFIDNDGIEHNLIRKRSKQTTLILDNEIVNKDGLKKFYKDKNIFLAAHNPYYFGSLEGVKQRNLLREVLPNVTANEAFLLLSKSEQEILKEPRIDLKEFITDSNSEIKELEKNYSFIEGQIKTLTNIALQEEKNIKTFDKTEELNILKQEYKNLTEKYGEYNIEDIEKKISTIDNRIQAIIEEFNERNDKYIMEEQKLEELKSFSSICPSCKQRVTNEEMKKHLINSQNKTLDRIKIIAENLKTEAQELASEKTTKLEMLEKIKNSNIKENEEKKSFLLNKIAQLEKNKEEILINNREAEIVNKQISEAKKNVTTLKKAQEEILQEIALTNRQIEVAKKLRILIVEEQMKKVKKYLNKVSIKFDDINKTTGEIKECYIVQYEGRDYNKLSKSEQTRTCLEISNLINRVSNLNAPIFLDDAESTTNINVFENTQMIIAIVIKHNGLEILQDYSDVLKRKKESVEKELNYNNEFILKNVA